MTGITNAQLNEIIDTTLKDMPKLPVVDLLCNVFTDEETDIAIDFIKKYYTKEKIFAGIEEYTQRCKFMFKLYGFKK